MKYDFKLIQKAKKLFPNEVRLHDMMKAGDRKAIDYVYSLYEKHRVEFVLDEDSIIKLFKNNQQDKMLSIAVLSRDTRKLFKDMYDSES